VKRRDFVLGIAAAMSVRMVRAEEPSQNCKVLGTEHVKNYPDIVHLSILRPGSYCLDRDWRQSKIWGLYSDRSKSDMLTIRCGRVSVDMRDHIIECNFERSGISLSAAQNKEFFRMGGESIEQPGTAYSADSLDNRFVTLRNGTIDLTSGERTAIGVELMDAWGKGGFSNRFGYPRPPRAIPDTYIRNEYLLDNLKIYTLDIGVLLEGTHNVIRNCVIHAQGQTAIAGAGPNLTIENCEIWLKPSAGEHHVDKRAPRAAIHLRDGSRAVIRNNVIRLSPTEDDSPSAILIRDGARDVLIENNTFVNVKGEPVVLAENSQAIVRDNKMQQRRVPW
jgi:hypothetical protein